MKKLIKYILLWFFFLWTNQTFASDIAISWNLWWPLHYNKYYSEDKIRLFKRTSNSLSVYNEYWTQLVSHTPSWIIYSNDHLVSIQLKNWNILFVQNWNWNLDNNKNYNSNKYFVLYFYNKELDNITSYSYVTSTWWYYCWTRLKIWHLWDKILLQHQYYYVNNSNCPWSTSPIFELDSNLNTLNVWIYTWNIISSDLLWIDWNRIINEWDFYDESWIFTWFSLVNQNWWQIWILSCTESMDWICNNFTTDITDVKYFDYTNFWDYYIQNFYYSTLQDWLKFFSNLNYLINPNDLSKYMVFFWHKIFNYNPLNWNYVYLNETTFNQNREFNYQDSTYPYIIPINSNWNLWFLYQSTNNIIYLTNTNIEYWLWSWWNVSFPDDDNEPWTLESVYNFFKWLWTFLNKILTFFTQDIPELLTKLKEFLISLINFWNTTENKDLFSFLIPSANADLVDDFFVQPSEQTNNNFLTKIVIFSKSWALLLVFVSLITILLLVYKNK